MRIFSFEWKGLGIRLSTSLREERCTCEPSEHGAEAPSRVKAALPPPPLRSGPSGDPIHPDAEQLAPRRAERGKRKEQSK